MLMWYSEGVCNDNMTFLFQYIQQNIRSDCSNIEKILEPPEGQDEGVWKYEHLRYVKEICDLKHLLHFCVYFDRFSPNVFFTVMTGLTLFP